MTDHKAPTDISFAPTSEKSSFQAFITRSWPWFAGVFVIGSAIFLGTEYMSQKAAEDAAAEWDGIPSSLFTGGGDSEELVAAASIGGAPAPWLLGMAAVTDLRERKYEAARGNLDKLSAEYPDHPLNSERFAIDEDGNEATLSEHMKRAVGEKQAWEQEFPQLFSNPPAPDGSPKVVFGTELGDITIALYPDRAPKHVENFVARCRDGYYLGTRFHSFYATAILGGDPNSIDGEKDTWGKGGPEETIESEQSELFAFKGAFGSWKVPPSQESHGSQFFLAMDDTHLLDGRYTIFGQVVDGDDVLDKLAELPRDGGAPESPPALDRVEVID